MTFEKELEYAAQDKLEAYNQSAGEMEGNNFLQVMPDPYLPTTGIGGGYAQKSIYADQLIKQNYLPQNTITVKLDQIMELISKQRTYEAAFKLGALRQIVSEKGL